MMRQKPRKYDRQFKLDVIEHCLATKKSMRSVANDFGVSEKTFYGWMKEYQKNGTQSFKGQGVPTASNEEIVALKKQLVDLKMENDILKKAAAIFLSPKK